MRELVEDKMMASVDVESITSAGSPWVVPLIEANLAAYTALMEENRRNEPPIHTHHHQHQRNGAYRRHSSGAGRAGGGAGALPAGERRVAPEECCGYCDIYREGTLTVSKQYEIDVWRRQVNETLIQQARHSAAAARQAASRHESLRQLKRYSAPGTPDVDPGFRRVPRDSVTGSVGGSRYGRGSTATTAGGSGAASSTAKHRSTSAHGSSRKPTNSMSVDLGSLSLGASRSSAVIGRSNAGAKHTVSSTGGAASGGGGGVDGLHPPVSSLNSSRSQSQTSSSQDSKTMTKPHKSTSNELLNVVTIDDYIYRPNPEPNDASAAASTSNGRAANGFIGHRPRTKSAGSSYRKKAGGGLSTGRSDVTGSTHTISFPVQDHAERTAKSLSTGRSNNTKQLGTITERREASNVHQRLYNNGAIPSHARNVLNVQEQMENQQPESKTFRRLHRNLHKWIDDELLKPRQMFTARREKLHSAGGGSNDRSSMKHSSVYKSAPSLLPDNGNPTSIKDPKHGDSFLGMLIEMDQSGATTSKTDRSVDDSTPKS